jgi:hypothetical protein
MAKMKLNLKDFDFKQFLIQKGERIALWAMVLVMAVLIVFGVFINGFSRGSSSGTASDITKLNDTAQSALKSSRPGEDIKMIDPYFMTASAMPRLIYDLISCLNPCFMTIAAEDKKGRKPDVLSPDEFQVNLMRGLIRTFIPATKDGKPALMCLRVKSKDPKVTAPTPMGPGMSPRGPNMQMFNRMVMGMGMRPGGPGPGPMGPMGFPAAMFPGRPGPGGAPMGPSMPGVNQGVGDPDRDVEMFAVTLDSLSDLTKESARPAEAVIPRRFAVIQAAFPYKRQFEVFQRALRYKSIEEMEQNTAVEFVGLVVERREIGPDGKPGKWVKLDLIKDLRPFLAFGIEPEDEKMLAYGLVWPKDRLVIPRPFLARDLQYPPTELKTIKSTLKAIEDAQKAGELPPPLIKNNLKNKFAGEFDFIAGDDDANGDPTRVGPMGRGPMPVLPRPPAVGPRPVPGPGQVNAAFGSQERLLPEKCLVRFIDVLLEPGKTYEYQMQIEMANPLFGRHDLAISKQLADEKKIVGEPTPVPQKLFVPAEGDFYFVEDPAKVRQRSSNPDRAWVQVHRWLDWVPVNPSAQESRAPIGDWSIADTDTLRGEYIGKWEEVDLPVWNPKAEAFVLAQHPETLKRRGGVSRVMQHKGVAVDFTTGSLLVDFDGGRADILYRDKAGKEVRVRDEAGTEALVLSADGKRLLVRDGRKDREDSTRDLRIKEWTDWVKAVREKNTTIKGDKKSTDFFNEKKP